MSQQRIGVAVMGGDSNMVLSRIQEFEQAWDPRRLARNGRRRRHGRQGRLRIVTATNPHF